MRIALFDHVVSVRSPAGSCDVRVLEALRDEHDITVFASELAPTLIHGSVHHVALRSVRRPALAAFLVYLVRAWACYKRRWRRGDEFDLIHATDCSFPYADVCYAHFCHRAYLSEVWPLVRGRLTPRAVHSWLTHAVRALIEARLARGARVIVVPSEGLAREVMRVYPNAARKVCVIRNTVDVERYERPRAFDRDAVRERMRTAEIHTAFVFVALGHFERKGLPILLRALATDELAQARVWVIGGERGLVASYVAAAERMGLRDRVQFAGRTDDVRPFLWSADAFISPSHYEAFSLGLLEAAAAGLPLLATRISGSEELLENDVNGLELEPTVDGVRTGLVRFVSLDTARRNAMGLAARESVEPLRPERFAEAWRSLYASL